MNTMLPTLFQDFDNLFNTMRFAPNSRLRSQDRAKYSTFPVDVLSNSKEYIVLAELPGVKKESISLSADKDKLTIAVDQSNNDSTTDSEYVYKEISRTSSSRSIMLKDIDRDGECTAEFTDGVLKIVVPKKTSESVRKIDIL